MRRIILLGASIFAAQPAVAEMVRGETCRKAEDVRLIQVQSPGEVGLACDVVYTRDAGARVSVPYNANVDKDYCRARASELAANLIAEGFECEASSVDEIEAALEGGRADIAEAVDAEGSSAPAPMLVAQEPAAMDASLDEQLEHIIAEAPIAEKAVDQAASVPSEALAFPQAVESEIALVDVADEYPSSSPEPATTAEPVQLAAGAQPSEFRAPKPPKSSGPGRLVGASPSIEDIIDVAANEPATVKPPPSGGSELPARPIDEIIKGVMAANAAAWNEGNLDAFMDAYLNSAELMMVRNAAVTTGWRDVKKSFEADIAAMGGMGRLTFSDMNVSMTSANVATVVGRYLVATDAATSDGVMTLVLKQADGRWRVVQDTRVAAPANP